MGNRIARAVVVAVTSLASVLSFASSAVAGPGAGTYTRITTPASDLHYRFDPSVPASGNFFSLAGVASPDVSAVNIFCFRMQLGGLQAAQFAGPVPVVNGSFSTTAVYPYEITNCRLRAVPSSVTVPANSYLASYTGPVLYTEHLRLITDASGVAYQLDAQLSQPNGFASIGDSGGCGVSAFVSTFQPALQATDGPLHCALRLSKGNIDPTNTSTRTTVQVDGHNAYLPEAVHSELRNNLGLPVKQSALFATLGTDASGNATLTEYTTLMRCAGSDVYPPVVSSCSTLVDVGVNLIRVTTILPGGYQVRIRDAFTSMDGAAHTVALEYQSRTKGMPTGTPGVIVPGQSAFTVPPADQVVTGLGPGSTTMYVRPDLQAAPDDPGVVTAAITSSRAPTSIVFSHQGVDWYGMRFGVAVPAAGRGSIGFDISQAQTTAEAQLLASADRAEMMSAPSITSPVNGARIGTRTTTVSGQLAAGANGLPASVTVNGAPASITPTSASTATFSARVSLPWGTHAVPVVATDAGGNSRAASVVVTNAPALAAGTRARLSRSTLRVPVTCRAFSAGTCTGRIVVRSARGAVLGKTGTFGVRRGRTASVGVRIRPGVHVVRVYLYQREPTGAYVLVATKTYHV